MPEDQNKDSPQSQLETMKTLVELSRERNKMAAERTKMSAERSYMNVERTLSVWIRTALALMIFGIAIDRFGLLIQEIPRHAKILLFRSNAASAWAGTLLVAFGTFMVIITGIRFMAYARRYKKQYSMPYRHHAVLAPVFAFLAAVFGVVLLIIMLSLN